MYAYFSNPPARIILGPYSNKDADTGNRLRENVNVSAVGGRICDNRTYCLIVLAYVVAFLQIEMHRFVYTNSFTDTFDSGAPVMRTFSGCDLGIR
jgi:hypothetical protein